MLKSALENCDSRIEDETLREATKKEIRLRTAEIEKR